MRYEVLRWVRSKRLALVLLVFLFSGATSPLVSAYLPELFEAVGGGGLEVTVPEPTWQLLLASYFKNSSQLALLFACYLAAWGCALGGDERLRIFYLSRVRRASQVFGPRLLVSGGAVVAATALGAAVALYETAVLVPGTDLSRATTALAVQAAGLTVFAVLAGCVACWTGSPAGSTVVVLALVLVGGLLQSAEAFRAWSPTVLVRPDGILDGQALSEYVRPSAVVVVVVLCALLATLLRPMRRLDMMVRTGTGPTSAGSALDQPGGASTGSPGSTDVRRAGAGSSVPTGGAR